MKRLWGIIAGLLLLISAGRGEHYNMMPSPNAEYARYTYEDSLHNRMPYRMLSPEDIKEGEKYPLVIFLHGSGERGDDNETQLTNGASIFANPVNLRRYPAYVVFPQCRDRSWTTKVEPKIFMPGAQVPPESLAERQVMGIIDNVIKDHPIDTSRIYILGISMGGIAVYDLAYRYPERFAAAVPICGAVNPDRLKNTSDISFLIFHGAQDEEVPVLCSRKAYMMLDSIGAKVDYVEFAGEGHECWTSAFNYPTLLPWLFAQTKKK